MQHVEFCASVSRAVAVVTSSFLASPQPCTQRAVMSGLRVELCSCGRYFGFSAGHSVGCNVKTLSLPTLDIDKGFRVVAINIRPTHRMLLISITWACRRVIRH